MLDNVPTASTSKTASHRKINKLMMEKRRRTRINNSLSELKTLVLKALKKDGEQFSKLEKVDILEMTVKYLRYLQHQQQITLTTDPVATKYRAGFSECATEVMRYMTSVTVSEDMRGRLNDHLSKCVRTTNAHPTTTSTSTTASQSPLCSLASAPPAQEVSTYPEPMMLPIGSKQTEAGLLLTENQFKSLPTYKSSSSSSSSSSTSEAGSASACRLNSVPTQTTVISSPLVSLKAFATPVSLTTSVPVLINSAAQCQQSTVSVANTTQSTPLFYNYTKSDCSAMASLHEDRLWRPW